MVSAVVAAGATDYGGCFCSAILDKESAEFTLQEEAWSVEGR
jgi:hypothetical protein